MPNHVKNVITFSANEAQVEAIVKAFGTAHPAKVALTYNDDKAICEDSSGNYGWLELSTGIFSRREEGDVIGVPDGYSVKVDQGFLQFPDFSKVISKPSVFDEIGEVDGRLVNHAKNLASVPHHTSPFIAMLESQNRLNEASRTLSEKDNAKVELMAQAYRDHGACYWYDWQRENWGTKWNAYSCERIGWKSFSFDTAWSCAQKITDAIHAAFPEVAFTLTYADEDTGNNCGVLTYANGSRSDWRPQQNSSDAYGIALMVRPDYAAYIKLVDGEYVCSYEEE